jgi:hypothetical protein
MAVYEEEIELESGNVYEYKWHNLCPIFTNWNQSGCHKPDAFAGNLRARRTTSKGLRKPEECPKSGRGKSEFYANFMGFARPEPHWVWN